jgi:hypothetical protein
MKRYFREPIVHFVILGALLVFIHSLWNVWQGVQGRTITVSASEIERLSQAWSNTSGRAPNDRDIDYIIDQYVKEEVLVREAQRLGLEEGDVIMRRRLAQKMDFLISAEGEAEDASDRELRAFYEENKGQFASSERRSFNHIYLSPEKYGDGIESQAQQILEQLKSGVDWKGLGDPFIQKRSYAVIPQAEVGRLFGPDFATAIFALNQGQWSGPIGSAFGLHLVRIETVDDALQADFEAVKAQVRDAWRAQQQLEFKAQKVDDLVSGYTILIEDIDK